MKSIICLWIVRSSLYSLLGGSSHFLYCSLSLFFLTSLLPTIGEPSVHCLFLTNRVYSFLVKVKSLSHVRLFATPGTVACQAPPSMGFSRQEYWSGLPFPSPGDLPDSGIKPRSPKLPTDTLLSEPLGKPVILRALIN